MKLTTIKPSLPLLGPTLPTVGRKSWRAGKTTNERGYTYRWQQARERFLFKNPLCCYCKRENRVELATVVDHIRPHNGNQELFWEQANWQPLCKPHHDSQKQREERGTATPHHGGTVTLRPDAGLGSPVTPGGRGRTSGGDGS